MSVRATIADTFNQVASEQKRQLAPLTDDLRLAHSGLDSLSFAIVVVRLEEALGYDPFAAVDRFPTTFGEFRSLYETVRS